MASLRSTGAPPGLPVCDPPWRVGQNVASNAEFGAEWKKEDNNNAEPIDSRSYEGTSILRIPQGRDLLGMIGFG
jgi:hypothetical protein